MSKSTAKKAAEPEEESENLLPASTRITPEVHAKVVKAAADDDRTVASQLRRIITQWAEGQPAA